MFREEFLKQKVLITLILLVMIWFSFGFLSSKEGPTDSEALAYAVVNAMPVNTGADGTSATIQSYSPTWHQQAYYQNYTHLDDNENFSYGTVYNNCTKNGLAPLYYFLLHTLVSFFHYIINFSIISFTLNSIFLFGACYIVFLIAAKYLKNGWVGIAASILFGFSVSSISGMICTQPYIMTIFFVLADLYLLLKIIDEREIQGSVCRSLILITTLGILTDYAFLSYIAISSLLFSITLLLFGHFRDFFLYLFTLVISFLFVLALYPSIIGHILGGFLTPAVQTTSTPFTTLLIDSVLFIKKNLFIKEGLFVGMLLVILGLFTFILKKITLKLHFESFIQRIATMEIADLFLCILNLAYFIFLVLLIPTDNYHNWIILFPLTALTVTYLVYRLAHGFITSDFNSSLIGVIMACLVCVFGINCTQPMFLNEGYTSQLNLAKQNENSNCIFIDNRTNASLSHIMEIQCYQNTMLLDSSHLTDVCSTDEIIKDSNSLIVYISQDHDTEKIASKLFKEGNYHFSDTLSLNSGNMTVYKLYR